MLISLFLFVCPAFAENKLTKHSYKSGGVIPELQQGLQLKHANLSFKIFPEKKQIEVTASLTLFKEKESKMFALDLDSNFQILSVSVNNQILKKSHYNNPEGLLVITSQAPLSGQFSVTIHYKGSPHEAKRPPWEGGMVWKKTKSGEHWIGSAIQDKGCDILWPCIDYIIGEPEKLDLYIDVPTPLVAASNGVLKSVKKENARRIYHWQSKTSNNNYGISLNIAPYELIQKKHKSLYGNSIDLQYYHLPENTVKAKKLFAEFPRMLDFFEKVIGPYPFAEQKMGVAETPFLGMEHQTINAYGNHYKKDIFDFDWLLHHEFAHEWFGNQVTIKNWDDIWLHEGFASYMQPLYAQYLHGDMAYYAYLHKHKIQIKNVKPMVLGKVLSENEVMKKSNNRSGDVYYKGSLILHTLRQYIGDDAFFRIIRRFVYNTAKPHPGNFKPHFMTTKVFIEIVNEETGMNMQWFFNAYLYQAKLPQLKMKKSGNSVSFSWHLESDKTLTGSNNFSMPLEISVNGKLQVLNLAKNHSVNLKPEDVLVVDPASKILRDEPYLKAYLSFKNKSEE